MLELGSSLASRPYLASDYMFRLARTRFELEGFWKLRREVFCLEQEIFQETDRDQYDDSMIPIVCVSLLAGMADQVVGCVRIDQRAPRVWWGSRLAVDRGHRRLSNLSPSVAERNRLPDWLGMRSIGAGLIYKAVSTAHRLGCETFLAHVQAQNAAFFRRLHWTTSGEIQLHGLAHVEMQADLAFYAPIDG